MRNHSDNWQVLSTLLAGFTPSHRTGAVLDYREHAEGRMLGHFLAHATLTTPKLSRQTVIALLAGELGWPRQDGTYHWERLDVSVEQLEQLGLIAFYADWCSIHSDYVRDPQQLDASLQPVLQALQLLNDIRSGSGGFAQPQYSLPHHEAHPLLAPLFGDHAARVWLETLAQGPEGYRWPTRDSRLSASASTQLWLTLRERVEPSQTFERWLECQCIGRDWSQSIDFAYLPFEERQVFIEQLTEHLATDRALAAPYSTLQRQGCNDDRFSQLLRPIQQHLHIHVDAEGVRNSWRQDVPQAGTTLMSLADEYPLPLSADTSPLQFAAEAGQRHLSRRGTPLFHLGLVYTAIKETVHLDGVALTSSGFAERLLELARSRPILRYLALVALPQFDSHKRYLLLLLSRADTSDAALLYLANYSHTQIRRTDREVSQSLDSGYHQVLCSEYRRSIEKELHVGERLYYVVEHLAERCDWQTTSFASRSEYRLLITFLQGLSGNQIVQLNSAYTAALSKGVERTGYNPARPHRYFIAFWLLERLEQLPLNTAVATQQALQSAIFNGYAAEFADNIQAVRRTLEPEECYAALPWYRCVEAGRLPDWLRLSQDYHSWLSRLSATDPDSFSVARVIRQYLQVLMSLQPPQLSKRDHERVVLRVANIIFTLGFGQREVACWLFEPGMQSERDRVWDQFSRYLGHFPDSLFEEFQERCVPHVPLDMLFTLLENNPVLERQQQLQHALGQRHASQTEEMGLTSLEQAFVSAVNSGQLELAGTLIRAAEEFMGAERFANTRNSYILQGRKAWASYQYKWQLLMLMEQLRATPDEFARQAAAFEIPHTLNVVPHAESERRLHHDCLDFRQYIVAAAYRDSNPGHCARSIAQLFAKTQDPSHGLLLLQSQTDLCRQDSDRLALIQTLHGCLASVERLPAEQLTAPWVATLLEAYALLGDPHQLDALWARLSWHQQTRLEILRPYCGSLISRGDVLVAQQLVNRYRELNPLALQSGCFVQLMDQLSEAAPSQVSLSQMVQLISHDSRRSVAQLTIDYRQILALDFHQYVEVVGNGASAEAFLAQNVLEVAGELLLRKKNLQLHAAPSSTLHNRRISHEDLINDWFTSLFDKRMAEARIGLRDQKRAGESASGKSPGEVDGLITDSKSRRLALFEAFRLFSLDFTVISEHLDKIARYDQECLSPVFIVAYCDVSDFAVLRRGYAELIENRDYYGFQRCSDVSPVGVLRCNSNVWLAREQRVRNGATVTLFHLLLNLRSPDEQD